MPSGLRGGDKACPHRLAETRHEKLPLQRLHAPAELDEARADRGIVDLAEIAGEQFVGQPHAGGDGMQLNPHVGLIAAAGRGGCKLHILARFQIRNHARLEELKPRTTRLGDRLGQRIIVFHARDKRSKARLKPLAHEFGIIIGVEIA